MPFYESSVLLLKLLYYTFEMDVFLFFKEQGKNQEAKSYICNREPLYVKYAILDHFRKFKDHLWLTSTYNFAS